MLEPTRDSGMLAVLQQLPSKAPASLQGVDEKRAYPRRVHAWIETARIARGMPITAKQCSAIAPAATGDK